METTHHLTESLIGLGFLSDDPDDYDVNYARAWTLIGDLLAKGYRIERRWTSETND